MSYDKYKSKMGYRDDSPFRNEEYLDIYSPNGVIDMSNTGVPLLANGGRYLPPYSGLHQFDTPWIREEKFNYGGAYLPMAVTGLETPAAPIAVNRKKNYSDMGWFAEEEGWGQRARNRYGERPYLEGDTWAPDWGKKGKVKISTEGGHGSSVLSNLPQDFDVTKAPENMRGAYHMAIAAGASSDAEARIMAAQWALESSQGKSKSATEHYNYFGIKGDDFQMSTNEVRNGKHTTENAGWAGYDSPLSGFQARVKFTNKDDGIYMKDGYGKDKSDLELANILSKVGYATSPTYAANLKRAMGKLNYSQNLTEADLYGNSSTTNNSPAMNINALTNKTNELDELFKQGTVDESDPLVQNALNEMWADAGYDSDSDIFKNKATGEHDPSKIYTTAWSGATINELTKSLFGKSQWNIAHAKAMKKMYSGEGAYDKPFNLKSSNTEFEVGDVLGRGRERWKDWKVDDFEKSFAKGEKGHLSHFDIIVGKGKNSKGTYYEIAGGNRRGTAGGTFKKSKVYYDPETKKLKNSSYVFASNVKNSYRGAPIDESTSDETADKGSDKTADKGSDKKSTRGYDDEQKETYLKLLKGRRKSTEQARGYSNKEKDAYLKLLKGRNTQQQRQPPKANVSVNPNVQHNISNISADMMKSRRGPFGGRRFKAKNLSISQVGGPTYDFTKTPQENKKISSSAAIDPNSMQLTPVSNSINYDLPTKDFNFKKPSAEELIANDVNKSGAYQNNIVSPQEEFQINANTSQLKTADQVNADQLQLANQQGIESKLDTKSWSEIGHGALEGAGLIPAVGNIFDGVNAAWYTSEGDGLNAGFAAAAAVPIWGIGATVGKNVIKNANKFAPNPGALLKKQGALYTSENFIANTNANGNQNKKLLASRADGGDFQEADLTDHQIMELRRKGYRVDVM